MARIVFGVILLIGLLNSVMRNGIPQYDNSERTMGYIFGQLLFLALSIWLIKSGLDKRKAKKENI